MSTALAATPALCARCKLGTLPQLKEPSWHRDVHRTAADGMTTEPDPRAERIRDRKARKAARKQPDRVRTRTEGFAAVARKFVLSTQRSPEPPEDCADCKAIQDKRRYRLLGYDPTTHRAHMQEIR